MDDRKPKLTLRDVLARLESVEANGDQFAACCPAHEDTNPSLSIDENAEGRILLNCKAGCTFDAICAALDVEPYQLAPKDDPVPQKTKSRERRKLLRSVKSEEAKRSSSPQATRAAWKPTRRREAARYPYFEGDQCVAEIRRYEVEEGHEAYPDKTFRPFAYKPHEEEADARGFVWGLRGLDLPLYMQQEAQHAIEEGDVVFVVEGEKDVDNLAALGLSAVTCAGGAKKWKPRHTQALAKGRIVVVPDLDATGRDHAKTVAHEIAQIAEWVRVLDLSDVTDDAPKGYDISDWIEAQTGSTRAVVFRLLDLVDTLEDHEAPSDYRTAQEAEEEAQGDGMPSNPEIAASDVDRSLERFWYLDTKRDLIKINRLAFVRWLESEGFGKIYHGDSLEPILVRLQGKIMQRTAINPIKDHARRYCQQIEDDDVPGHHTGRDVEGALLRGVNIYFSTSVLEFLQTLEPTFARDTADSARFFYRNGFVKVTASTFEFHDYDDLEGVIWKDQILDRDFTDLRHESPESWDWARHLWFVSGQDEHRHNALCTSLGYLLHSYKDPAQTRAIVFMDERVSENEEGRTGKSVTTKGLGHMIPSTRIDARNWSFDSRFVWQGVDFRTDLVDFNDAPRTFDFQRLFAVLTDDMTVENKGETRIQLGFDESPKFVLTTNYTIEGQGASFEERIFQVEFHRHYKPGQKPLEIFGRRFFDGWDTQEWARFDNIMMACVRQYLKFGLYEYEHVNLPYKRLHTATTWQFAEWVLRQQPEREYSKGALFNSFREAFPGEFERLTQHRFTTWMKSFASIYKYDVEERWPGDRQIIAWYHRSDSIERKPQQSGALEQTRHQEGQRNPSGPAPAHEQGAFFRPEEVEKQEEPEWPAQSPPTSEGSREQADTPQAPEDQNGPAQETHSSPPPPEGRGDP